MFKVIKTRTITEYIQVLQGEQSIYYGWTRELGNATVFETYAKAESALKTSGFNAIAGVSIIENDGV